MQRGSLAARRQGRRWRFGDALFDEAGWQLLVGEQRQPLEGKPLELLHELLLHAGQVVSKDQMLDSVWPDVHVVEGSIPTAIGKLRKALGDDRSDNPIIETVPRIGYRLVCAVTCEAAGQELAEAQASPHPRRWLRWTGAAAALTGTVAVAAMALGYPDAAKPTADEVIKALLRLDQPRIEAMLRAGWDPNSPLDDQGNTALNQLISVCEWDPGHDRRAVLMLARALLDGGTVLDRRNYWGDTPYSIAKATRYCGPDHPVTVMIRAQCYNGFNAPSDECLADYKHSAAARNGGKAP